MYGSYFIRHRLLGLVHRLYALYKSGLYEVSTKTICRNLFIDKVYVYTLRKKAHLYIMDKYYIRWILHLGIVYEYKIRLKIYSYSVYMIERRRMEYLDRVYKPI